MTHKTPLEESLERLAEEKVYEQVYEEVANGIKREGIWFKALSESDGEESKAKGLYVKYRVRSLIDELIVTEKILQDENKAQQIKDKEVAERNKQLAIARDRLAISRRRETSILSFFGVIRILFSIGVWFMGLFFIVEAISSGLPPMFIAAVFFCLVGYLIWPKKP